MAQYDGSIRIDTKMDTKGVEKGTENIRSQAAKLAAEYRKTGLSQSDAFKKAWSEIERTTKKSSKKVGKGFKFSIAGMIGSLKGLALTIASVFALRKIIDFGKELSNLATNLESSMLRVNEIFRSSNTLITDFVNNAAKGLGLSQKTAFEFAAIYGNLFSTISNGTEENAQLTVRMLRASAVVASKTGRTMTDVMDRIRSGVLGNTEAIEDLGINVNVAMLEMTDAFQRIAGDRSWDQLNFKEQQQIRVLGILEQSHKKYGDEVLKSSAFTKQRFASSLENLKTTIGNILNVAVIPMIDALTRLNEALNEIFVKTFGKYSQAQVDMTVGADDMAKAQDKVGDSIEKSGKKAKKSLAAFDNLNILQSQETTEAGPGGAAGIDLTAGFTEAGEAVTEVETPVNRLIEKIKTIATIINTVFAPSIENLNFIFKDMYSIIETVFTDLKNVMLPMLKNFVMKGIQILIPYVNNTINLFTKIYEGVSRIFKLIWETAIKPVLTLIAKITNNVLDLIVDYWNEWGQSIFNNLGTSIKMITDTIINFYQKFLQPIIETTLDVIEYLWDNHFKYLIENLLDFIGSLSNNFLKLLNEVIIPFVNKIIDRYGPMLAKSFKRIAKVFTLVVGIIVDIVAALVKVFQGIITFLTGVFTGDWRHAWEGVKQIFTGIFDGIKAVFGGVINWIIKGLNFMIDKINSLSIKVPDWVPEIGGRDFGFNLKKINELQLNYQPTAPEPTAAQYSGYQPGQSNALQEALEAFRKTAEGGGTSQQQEVVLEIDGNEIGRAVVPYTNKANQRMGVSLVTGGGY